MKQINIDSFFLEKLRKGDIFFFAGSGTSYLSFLPSAGKVLCKTTELFLPQEDAFRQYRDKILIDERNYKIQPEVFYEILLYLFRSQDTLSLWQILSPSFLKTYNCAATPNINHLFIVNYSVKHGIPVFTTNFDCLFEEAAHELGYNPIVVLPHSNNQNLVIDAFNNNALSPGSVYIFKLHGSINSMDTLCTTMTSITRANFPAINFLASLRMDKHITFLGYSGRDIDYFPELQKQKLCLRPFWIDEFHDPATYENSKYIDAVRINCYPQEVFKSESPHFDRVSRQIDDLQIQKIFTDLQATIRNSIAVTTDEKYLLMGLLIKEIGEYKVAYKLLSTLFLNNSLSLEGNIVLLLALSSLAHENSKYVSCGSFAKKALKGCSKKPHLNSFRVMALCQLSESRRMLIAHDTSFAFHFNYLDGIFSLSSFIYNGILMRKIVRSLKLKADKDKSVVDIFAIHNFIEHRIRCFALLQAALKPVIGKNSFTLGKILRKFLISKWTKIYNDSSIEGYSHGKANALKFVTRITGDLSELSKGQHIYDLTTYETGKALALRNIAEDHFDRGNYSLSKQSYYDFFQNGIRSGNKLNAIKGLLGLAKCNRSLNIDPLLEHNELKTLKELMKDVEGKNWQEYFSKVLRYFE